MTKLPLNQSFANATVFESGYLAGFAQFEVRQIRFHIASATGLGEYQAATFVARGKRKQKTVPVGHLVVIEGWGHPTLETDFTERSEGIAYHKAKFSAFSEEWDTLGRAGLALPPSSPHHSLRRRAAQRPRCGKV